jgi:DivIVA domain-containing protein
MRRKKSEGEMAPGASGRVTPADVQQVEFRLAFRGYSERDVDAFLDRVTEDLSAYIEENQRLRAGQPAAAAVPASVDVGSARSEAQRILEDAREEAARIVRDAHARAAASGAPAGDARAGVAPFLNTEREFLQSLGALVQGHAEEVKQMVLALRARAEASGTPAAASAPVVETEPEQGSAGASAEEAFAPITVPAAEGEAEVPADDAGTTLPEPTPVRLRTDSGERSLRELFWGED